MPDKVSSRVIPFNYMPNQAKALRESLEQAGFPSDIDWSRLLLAITQIARVAQTKANIDKPLYAAEAAKQARHLAKAMSSAATGYETLSGEMQGLVASYLGLVHDELPLLRDSLLPSERPVLRKLSSATRLLRRVAASARRAGPGADQDIGGRDSLVADTGGASRSGIDGELCGVLQAGRGSVWPTIWSPK